MLTQTRQCGVDTGASGRQCIWLLSEICPLHYIDVSIGLYTEDDQGAEIKRGEKGGSHDLIHCVQGRFELKPCGVYKIGL